MAAEWQRPLNWSPNGKVFFPLRLRIRRSVEPPPVPRSYRPAARTFSESATSLEPPLTQSRRGDREPDPDRAQRHHTLSGRATVPSQGPARLWESGARLGGARPSDEANAEKDGTRGVGPACRATAGWSVSSRMRGTERTQL